jgi:hypothetical protein
VVWAWVFEVLRRQKNAPCKGDPDRVPHCSENDGCQCPVRRESPTGSNVVGIESDYSVGLSSSDKERFTASRSRSLFPAVLIALNTCMRYSELRLLKWGQVDLTSCTLTVGQSKTESGTGRLLPLNDRAVAILGFWASLFPERKPNHFVFPAERYGTSGDGLTVIYESDPT